MPAYAMFADKVYADEALMKELGYSKGKFEKPKDYEYELNCEQYQKENQLPSNNGSSIEEPDIF